MRHFTFTFIIISSATFHINIYCYFKCDILRKLRTNILVLKSTGYRNTIIRSFLGFIILKEKKMDAKIIEYIPKEFIVKFTCDERRSKSLSVWLKTRIKTYCLWNNGRFTCDVMKGSQKMWFVGLLTKDALKDVSVMRWAFTCDEGRNESRVCGRLLTAL